ncbi:MAG: hypothetical protein ABI595_09830 [Actinomycetota bacterium]
MTKKLLTSVVVAALFAGCATAGNGASDGTTPSTSGPARVAIELPPLPPQGVVVQEEGGLTFLNVDGGVLYPLEDHRLYYQWTVPGPVIVRRKGTFYLLDVPRHILEPFESPEAAFAATSQFQDDLDLPLPPHPAAVTDLSGFWAYALPSPDGRELLAQWSGECEVPTAFFVVDGVPEPVTGERTFFESPNSRSLGWTARGDALVFLLPDDACGDKREPGIYAFRGPGGGELLYPVQGIHSSARMWGVEAPGT